MTRRDELVALLYCLIGLAVGTGSASGQEPTYCGAFIDGSYVAGGRISEWHDTGAQPKLNGAPLLDPTKPIRWLRNESAEPQVVPQQFVEMFGGDRLPGRVLEQRDSLESEMDRQPGHLLVRVEMAIDPPDRPSRTQMRVKLDGIRRVVWQRRASGRYMPGTLFYLDGRQVAFRSLRWATSAVLLLLEEGTRKVEFHDIAELHLPARNSWDLYYETLAALSPECTSTLMRVETFSGLIATTSLARFQARALSGDPSGWFHMLQPAWCLDPVWIRHTQIQWRRFFKPQEVALSQLEPVRSEQHSWLGKGWPWRVDRSVQGQSLRNAGRMYGWGFGVQAASVLEFTLPAIVKAFHVRVGLDEAAGRGGCARALVYVNRAEGTPLFQSQHLIGSATSFESGALALGGPAAGQNTLLLVADAVQADRPKGADPLDIRDTVDWLEPMLELDLPKLQAEVYRRWTHAVPAWDGWQIEQPAGASLQLTNHWDALGPQEARHRLDAMSQGGSLVLKRKARITAEQKYLVLTLGRYADVTTPSQIEIRINGDPVTDFPVPERRAGVTSDRYVLPLEKYDTQEINVEVVQTSLGDKGWVTWRGLGFSEYLTPTPWVAVAIKEAKSEIGAQLCVEADNGVLVADKLGDFDKYTILAETELLGISAVRLEALPDARSPNNGAGRENGSFVLSDFRLTVAPRDRPDEYVPHEFQTAVADFADNDRPAVNALDTSPQTGWAVTQQVGLWHAVAFTTREDVGFPGGTRLTIGLDQRSQPHQTLGHFRLSVTNVARPVTIERPATPLAYQWLGKALILNEDGWEGFRQMGQSAGPGPFETQDKFSGQNSIKVTGDRFNPNAARVAMKIRQNPAPGEFRYLQFAWKKPDGQAICMQLQHDGAFGPAGNAKFRYQAGPGPEFAGASLNVDPQLPTQWTQVTRDLFTDFGEFTLTGFALTSVDGQYALYDRMLLARAQEDFAGAK